MNFDISTPEGLRNATEWQRAHLARIAEGGVWYVPRVASSYVVSHANKTLTRSGMTSDPTINRVMKAIGWRVVERGSKGPRK